RLERDPAAGERPIAGARDARVEIAIDDVVIDAAGTAHRQRTQREPADQPRTLAQAPRQSDRPRAWPEQQPRPDRPVEPRQRNETTDPRRQRCGEPALLAVGDDIV